MASYAFARRTAGSRLSPAMARCYSSPAVRHRGVTCSIGRWWMTDHACGMLFLTLRRRVLALTPRGLVCKDGHGPIGLDNVRNACKRILSRQLRHQGCTKVYVRLKPQSNSAIRTVLKIKQLKRIPSFYCRSPPPIVPIQMNLNTHTNSLSIFFLFYNF